MPSFAFEKGLEFKLNGSSIDVHARRETTWVKKFSASVSYKMNQKTKVDLQDPPGTLERVKIAELRKEHDAPARFMPVRISDFDCDRMTQEWGDKQGASSGCT